MAKKKQTDPAALAAQLAQRQALADSITSRLVAQGVGASSFPIEVFEALQAPQAVREYQSAFGVNPTPSALRKQFDLTPEVHDTLRDFSARLEQQARQRKEARRQWERELITAPEARVLLGISKDEYESWLDDGRIPIGLRQPVIRGGQADTLVLHHPDELESVRPRIEQWRQEELAGMTPQARAARKRSIEKLQTRQVLADAIERVCIEQQCERMPDAPDGLRWEKTAIVDIYPDVPGHDGTAESWRATIAMQASAPYPRSPAEARSLSERVGTQFSVDAVARLAQQLEDSIDDVLASYESRMTPAQLRSFTAAVRATLESGISQTDLIQSDFASRLVRGPVKDVLDRIEHERVQELLQLKDYPRAFPLARSLRRRLHFKLGPTNSGKTHEALEALKAASSGVYLAPLRLLAMEVRDRLMADGVPCNLLTGEEHVEVPGARHTACTMEMMNPTREVRVAVIDEIQMLRDAQRGWAWTAALVGVPAREVYVCGSDVTQDICERVVQAMEETYDVTRLERMTPLEVESEVVAAGSRRGRKKAPRVNGLAAGDAVIAFSRKDVLTLSARYRDYGFSVATLYGALAPEVRRTEADRFASGEADIVVATDAIGMGLNLPIRRVVFSTVHKFDGEQTRELNPTEVRQIAGRAGRFGRYPKGFVSAMDPPDLRHVRKMLEQPEDISPAMRLPIAPSLWHIETLADVLQTRRIGALFSFFANRIAADSPYFETASLEDNIALGHLVDRVAPRLSLPEKFTFACAPVDAEKDRETIYFRQCLGAYLARRRFALPVPGPWVQSEGSGHLQEAEEMSKDLSLYAWLGFKFPEIFYEHEALPVLRARLSRYIEQALLRQAGFGLTSKEAHGNRPRTPHHRFG